MTVFSGTAFSKCPRVFLAVRHVRQLSKHIWTVSSPHQAHAGISQRYLLTRRLSRARRAVGVAHDADLLERRRRRSRETPTETLAEYDWKPHRDLLAPKSLSPASIDWHMYETQRGTVSSNSRFQTVLFQQYSTNPSKTGTPRAEVRKTTSIQITTNQTHTMTNTTDSKQTKQHNNKTPRAEVRGTPSAPEAVHSALRRPYYCYYYSY